MTNHPNRRRNAAELHGHYREEGGALVPGRLYLRHDGTGWYDPDMDFPGPADLPTIYVKAREYQVTPTMGGIEITGCGGSEFLPADGECERIGLSIERLVKSA